MCHFEGRYYPVGHVLDIKHPTHCVTCTCKTPPDFTCIHSSCPPPPNGDYANCRAVYKPNACCPDYKCHDKKGNVPDITPVLCLCIYMREFLFGVSVELYVWECGYCAHNIFCLRSYLSKGHLNRYIFNIFL